MHAASRQRYAAGMTTTKYRVVPIATEVANRARAAAAAGASDHALVVADSPDAYPCRHCLRWATAGESLILFPFASVPPGYPYAESGPIFVHADACQRYAETEVFPFAFRKNRVLRAYDSKHTMIDAAVVNGDEPEAVIENLLENPDTHFIHVRSLLRGCYTMGIARA